MVPVTFGRKVANSTHSTSSQSFVVAVPPWGTSVPPVPRGARGGACVDARAAPGVWWWWRWGVPCGARGGGEQTCVPPPVCGVGRAVWRTRRGWVDGCAAPGVRRGACRVAHAAGVGRRVCRPRCVVVVVAVGRAMWSTGSGRGLVQGCAYPRGRGRGGPGGPPHHRPNPRPPPPKTKKISSGENGILNRAPKMRGPYPRLPPGSRRPGTRHDPGLWHAA